MRDYSDQILMDRRDKQRVSKFNIFVLLLVPLAAILFQVYVPMFFKPLAYLELPVLVTVYFSLMKQHQIAGTLAGATIGLAQDSLADHPLGMFGIVKTLVGYFASSLSMRFDVEHPGLRFLVGFFFFFFHELMYWVLTSALLGNEGSFALVRTLLAGALNAMVAVPLFALLDKLRVKS